MSTLRGWWKEDKGEIEDYYHRVLRKDGEITEDCTPDINKQIIEHLLQSPSMLAIFPLQDWLSINGLMRGTNLSIERINIPSNPAHHWKYRMNLYVENLLQEKNFNDEIKELIQRNKR